jgi:phage tail sheath protein FI
VGSGAGEFTVAQSNAIIVAIESYCAKRRALFLLDSPGNLDGPQQIEAWLETYGSVRHRNAALYFPGVTILDPLDNTVARSVGSSGAIAGVIARLDASRGIWKAPAGAEATLIGVSGLSYQVTDKENSMLVSLGVNCLRTFPAYGIVCWGARTLEGNGNSEWRYIPTRRLALFIEESVYRGTKWAVFEPNDETLWTQIRSIVSAFMHDLFLRGAFQGQTPNQAYFVKCDRDTNSRNDIDNGRLNILIGFAPLQPAEFLIVRIQQLLGQKAHQGQ